MGIIITPPASAGVRAREIRGVAKTMFQQVGGGASTFRGGASTFVGGALTLWGGASVFSISTLLETWPGYVTHGGHCRGMKTVHLGFV